MTTTENTRADTSRAPDLGFKNPANWAIAPVVGPLAAAVLVGGLTFIPTWAVLVIVVVVTLWVVAYSVDQSKRRQAAAK